MPLRLGRMRRVRAPRDGFRVVGRVARGRGLKGELKVEPLTDFPERFAEGATVYIRARPRTVLAANWQKDAVYVRVAGITDRTAADDLRDELIEVPDSQRPRFASGQFYIDEIEGCEVRGRDGTRIGRIREVLQPGANDVYVVERPGRKDLLVPAIQDVVVDVRVAESLIVVDLPDGLESADAPGDSTGA